MQRFISKALFAGLMFMFISSSAEASKHAGNAAENRITAPTTPSSPAALSSASSPLYVKVLPAARTQEDLENEAYDRGEKRTLDREVTKYTLALAVVGTLALLAAIAQGVLFFYQLRLMRASLADTKLAAVAAMRGAEASQQSAETAKTSMIASERAYVHFAGLRYISHTDLGDGHIFWRLRPHWRNSGNTPTRGLQVYVNYELRDDILPADYPFSVDISPNERPPAISLEPNGTIVSGIRDVRGTDLAEVARGTKHLYVWGLAKYRSVFEESGEHVTKFCVKAENLSGDPTALWNADAPFNIDFANENRHNCADEDCHG